MASTTLFTDRPSKVQSVLDFATHLTQWITTDAHVSSSKASQASPFADSDLYFLALPLLRKEMSLQQRNELDQKGVQLWNACCRSKSETGAEDEKHKLHVAKARAFAWLLVDSAAREKGKGSSVHKTLHTATRAAKDCLAVGDLQLGAKIVERLAERLTQIQATTADFDVDTKSSMTQMQVELLLLQMTLAWRRGRLDMAEHFYNLLSMGSSSSDPSLQVKLADLLYEIGQQLLRDIQNELAAKWLGRARLTVEEAQNNSIVTDAQDLRLNILHTYIRALLATNDPECGAEATKVLHSLKSDFGHKLAVTLLEIEILTKDHSPNVDAYYDGLLKIIGTVHLIDANHKLIMHHVHNLKALSLDHALRALKQYIIQRLAPDESSQRTESAIVTFIWMAISASTHEKPPIYLDADLNLFRQMWNQILSPDAAHAAFLLLWKRIEIAGHASIQQALVSWCELALNKLLENIGDRNAGKVQRKLVVYHVNQPDLQAANRGLDSMTGSVKQHPLSLYLTYSVALRSRNQTSAEAALASIVRLRDKDNKLLMACVGETMKYGDQRQGAKLLQRVLDRFNYDFPPEIDTCALLRCTARVLLTVLSEERHTDPEMLSRLCSIFRAAADFSSKYSSGSNRVNVKFSLEECRWFERNSFNVALKHLNSWPAKYVIDLMDYCTQMHHPEKAENDTCRVTKLKHYVNTIFIQALLYTAEARRYESTWTLEDLPRTSYTPKEPPGKDLLRYHLYRSAFIKYDLIQRVVGTDTEHDNLPFFRELYDEVQPKLVQLLPLAFEALLFMKFQDPAVALSLNDVGFAHIVEQASVLKAPAKTFAWLADLILSSVVVRSGSQADGVPQLPLSTAISLLSKVINAIRNQSEYDIVRASRWIRCVVQMVLDRRAQPEQQSSAGSDKREVDLQVVASIVDEALGLTHDASNLDRAESYPSDELQWLSSILFNLAVDYYVAENHGETKRWAMKAVEVAHALGRNPRRGGGDGGALAKALKGRCQRMGWDL